MNIGQMSQMELFWFLDVFVDSAQRFPEVKV